MQAIRWLDNNEGDKAKLVTNQSQDDLIYKENPGQVEVHKKDVGTKKIIKQYQLNMSDVTGV